MVAAEPPSRLSEWNARPYPLTGIVSDESEELSSGYTSGPEGYKRGGPVRGGPRGRLWAAQRVAKRGADRLGRPTKDFQTSTSTTSWFRGSAHCQTEQCPKAQAWLPLSTQVER